MDELSKKQRRFLQRQAHPLKPLAYVGRDGVSPPLVQSLEEVFAAHELIKIKLERSCPLDRFEASVALAAAAKAQVVQVIGHVVILYRADLEQPSLQLPAE